MVGRIGAETNKPFDSNSLPQPWQVGTRLGRGWDVNQSWDVNQPFNQSILLAYLSMDRFGTQAFRESHI